MKPTSIMPARPEKLGKVHFPVSCDTRAQQEFEQAVGAIHSFWYEEAEKKFTEATARDPDCSMGYWGIAMSSITRFGILQTPST